MHPKFLNFFLNSSFFFYIYYSWPLQYYVSILVFVFVCVGARIGWSFDGFTQSYNYNRSATNKKKLPWPLLTAQVTLCATLKGKPFNSFKVCAWQKQNLQYLLDFLFITLYSIIHSLSTSLLIDYSHSVSSHYWTGPP